jgi:hypothetical protein
MWRWLMPAARLKDMISSLWSVDARQVDKATAEYSDVGLKDGKACASCNWMVAEDTGCVLVWGDIMQTGLCKFWLDKNYFMVVEKERGVPDDGTENKTGAGSEPGDKPAPNKPDATENKVNPGDAVLAKYKPMTLEPRLGSTLIDKVVTAIKSFMGMNDAQASPTGDQPVRPLMLFKSDEGLRFFAVMSNMYKDKHSEILSVEAHKEYVDWVGETGLYPELRLWHVPQAGIGKADWMDFNDGFLCTSGLIYADKEDVAYRVAEDNSGISMGFLGLITKEGVFTRYRAFELSALPAERAANLLTDFNLFTKEADMAFTDQKRAWLKEKAGVDDETIKQWESSVDGLAAQAKELGLEFKEAEVETGLAGEIKTLTEVVSGLAEQFKSFKDKTEADLVEAKKALDERVAETLAPRVAPTGGFQASTSETTVVKEKTADEISASWFGQIVAGAVPQNQ